MSTAAMSNSFFVHSPNRPGVHILLHRYSPRWIEVNQTGLDIALALDRGDSPSAIAQQMSARHAIDQGAALADVMETRGTLCSLGLLADCDPKTQAGPALPSRTPVLTAAYLHITRRCNLSCRQCYVDAKRSSIGPDLPTPAILRMIADLSDHHATSIVISGGEPLLHPDIRLILEKSAKHLTIRLLTNGTRITPDWAAFLADLPLHIQISLDGATAAVNDAIRGKGVFDRVLAAVDRLQAAGLGHRLILCATVMDQNLHQLTDIIALARRLGVPQVRFLPLRNAGAAHRHWNSLALHTSIAHHEAFYRHVWDKERRQSPLIDVSCGLSGLMLDIPKGFDDGIWCSVGRHLVVDAQGFVFPCVLMMIPDWNLGNVFETPLSGLIHSEKLADIACLLVRRRYELTSCAACCWQNLCQAGCMGQAYDNKGDVMEVDDFCRYRKGAYQRAFELLIDKGRGKPS